ncbi:MAG: hypothetical protein OXF06_03590 [Bacteroidetes bacterium]|nr:hypothetical protein [Bacteroidota bacterium]MCY4223900.1 hypothetical protein [Bacteroidota bacterium]
MIQLQNLLREKGIKSVAIIDDGFDEVPTPDELSLDDYSNFISRIGPDQEKLLSELYPEFLTSDQYIITNSPEFIQIVWNHRNQFSSDATSALFKDYDSFLKKEKDDLEQITKILQSFGLTCIQRGRELDNESFQADLIVIDLFLGSKRLEKDLNLAIKNLRKLVSRKPDDPPLVILMSNSNQLHEQRTRFRDESLLLASTFRVAKKTELLQEDKLELILSRLANNYDDAKKYAKFLYALENGLTNISKIFLPLFRKLDLSDLNQLRTLLLNAEGEQLGHYLLDVIDQVLQHEIEGNQDIIQATLELNKIQLDQYPAPHLMGTPDFQDLVYRMQFTHKNRLHLTNNNKGSLVKFGDVIRQKNSNDDKADEVFLVITPACDLVRNEISQVILLSGKLNELKPENWSYTSEIVKTSVIILDNQRKWIKWDLREVRTILRDDLKASLINDDLIQIGRLRELNALNLQHRVLQRLGRIGLTANLPAVFPVDVSFYYLDPKSRIKKLEIIHQNPATCYVGRAKNSKPIHHLVLSEKTCDQIRIALLNLSEESVHSRAQASLKTAKQDLELFSKFEQGEVEISSPKGIKFLKSTNGQILVALIRNDDDLKNSPTLDKNVRKAAIILHVQDRSDEMIFTHDQDY